MGGAFGMRSGPYPENILVLWTAKILGRPVKWTGDRSEAFCSDDQARDNVVLGIGFNVPLLDQGERDLRLKNIEERYQQEIKSFLDFV